MSSFTNKLTVTKINKREWRVERRFSYKVGGLSSHVSVKVPRGFITDFASVPRIFWIIFPPDGQYTQAAVVHDCLYHTHQFERKECDRIFCEAMEVLNVPRWKRWVMYKAVRTFGGFVWKKRG